MKKLISLLLILVLLLTGCDKPKEKGGTETAFGDDNTAFGDSLDSLGAYEGYFEEDVSDVTVNCISGTKDCYTLAGGVLTFTEISEETVCSISGAFKGCIVIDVGDSYKFDLELQGFSLVSADKNPITVKSGNEVSLTAKKGFQNYIYDKRAAIDTEDEMVFAGAIHSDVDLEIAGKGELTLVSENNNGIHSKDDLEVKNLTLLVACADNALKGNDSVEITGGTLTLIATSGDGIKTSNSDISDKGNQRGTVSITGGTHTIYAACDGIDASYNVIVDDSAQLNIYTDKYSNYSKEVTDVSASVYYIRYTSKSYLYSVQYYNSDDDYLWANAEHHSAVSGGRTSYYYYSFPREQNYAKIRFFIYSTDMEQGSEEEYLAASEYLTPSTAYDTFALSNRGGGLSYEWTNYTTKITEGFDGMGGMDNGNTDKGDHSTKGIKAANEIQIKSGTVNIKSYDDAVHANNDTALENGETPLGNITVTGGTLTVYTNDDGLHADGSLSITSGKITVERSYEGMEGSRVSVSGGKISIASLDDGINGTATSGTAISVSGGEMYIYCAGDGMDSNSRTSYSGIVFSGGNTVVISTSGGNSAIDTEGGYQYTGGCVVALMPRGGMSSEATHAQNFGSVGKSASVSLEENQFLSLKIANTGLTMKIPVSMSAVIVVLGDTSPEINVEKSSSETLDENGVLWN